MMLSYVAAFLVYYPITHAIEDEVGFINQALVWSKGVLSAEDAGFRNLADFVEANNGKHVGRRHPGRSLLIIPFLAAIGYRSIFLSGALIHLGLTLLAALILQECGKSPLWAVLVLAHPTLELYSRTIMGDTPAALCLLLALWFGLSRRSPGLLSGLALGAAALMRLQTLVVAPLFVVALAASLPRPVRWRETVRCGLAAGVITLGISIYNLRVLGSIFGFTEDAFFSLSFIPQNLEFYGLALAVIWPLMPVAVFFDRSRLRWFTLAVGGSMMALLLTYYFHDAAASAIETLVIGQRLLIPALPYLVISYAVVLDTALRGIIPRRLVAALSIIGCVVLCGSQWVVFRKHQQHLVHLASARDEVARVVPQGSLILSNRNLIKLFEVPVSGIASYRWREVDSFGTVLDHSLELREEKQPWFYAVLLRPGSRPPELAEYRAKYKMVLIPAVNADLIVYRGSSPAAETGP